VERQTFRYGLNFFYLRALLLVALCAFILAFLATQTTTPSGWLGLIAGVLIVYLLIVGLSPLLTKHELLRSRVILRQGWYFRAVIPLDAADEIGPWDAEPKYGLRITLARRTLYVVGSATELVSIRLQTPRRFSQVLFLTAREIVFDVDNRERFLAAVRGRKTEGPPLHARKVPILPAARR
jgi:hypothetical protein